MGNASARQVTGVGPRFAFTVKGSTGAINTDMVIGVDVVGSHSGTGLYHIQHNLGKTGYAAQFTPEHESGSNPPAAADNVFVYIADRQANGMTLGVYQDGTGLLDIDYIHGVIYD